jgi:hypothetical protein
MLEQGRDIGSPALIFMHAVPTWTANHERLLFDAFPLTMKTPLFIFVCILFPFFHPLFRLFSFTQPYHLPLIRHISMPNDPSSDQAPPVTDIYRNDPYRNRRAKHKSKYF